MQILVRNVTILSPQAGSDWEWDLIESGYVLIEDAEIQVVASGPVPPGLAADKEIDGSGKILLPGFVNLHSHAPMVLLRGLGEDLPLERWLTEKIFPAEDRLNEEDYYWGTKLAIAEMLLSGTTCFYDMYMGIPQMVEAVVETGIRACLGRGLVGDPVSAQKALTEALACYTEFQGAGAGRVSFLLAPHGTYTCTPELLRIVAKEAAERGLGIHIHLSETVTENQTVVSKYQKTPTAILAETGLLELPLLAAHAVHLTESDQELLLAAGAGVAHCPASNMKLASGVAPVADWRQKGLAVGLGTDGAASNNNLDMYEELRLAGYLQKVTTGDPSLVPAGYLLQRAVFGFAGRGLLAPVGRVEPGFQADLQLVNCAQPHLQPQHSYLSNLVYAAKGSDVDTVLVAGKVVVENGSLTTIDTEELLYEASKRARKLGG